MAKTVDPRFLGDANRQARQDALATRAQLVEAEARREQESMSPEDWASEAVKYALTRALLRPLPDAPHHIWASYLSQYPRAIPWETVGDDNAPLATPAELSLGQVLDALPEDSPWLARLERADEDFGRPLGDCLRLRRWSSVLVDMHFPNLCPDTRAEFIKRYFDAVWKAYGRFGGWA
jgi:hypothetical protein